MSIGLLIRGLLGPLEKPISNLYRGIFIDLKAFTKQIKKWVPEPNNILELGCGEGAVIEELTNNYIKAHITGIDITPRVGRMFQGDLTRVTFKEQTIKDFVKENYGFYDLLIISDVIHHVPWELHKELLTDAAKSLKLGGYIVFKEWERNRTPIHLLCYLFDRYITGDKVRYKSYSELRMIIEEIFGQNSIQCEARINPWKNNIAFLIRII